MPLLVAGLTGCQLLGWDSESEQPRQVALRGEPQEALDYPSLHTVPPRPQLSYSVEQRREIVERLIADRAYARYTDQRVRFESGLSSLPPPPEPPERPAETEADRIVAARPKAPAASPDQTSAEQGTTGRDYRTLDSDDERVDDGTLGDFMRNLVRDTAPTSSAPDDGAAPAPEQGAASPDSAPASSETGAEAEPPALADRLFGWIGDLFGEDEPAAPPAVSATAVAPWPPPPKPALPAPVAVVAVNAPLPLPKPASIASPPRPGPAKPVLARAPTPGDLELVVSGAGPDEVRPVTAAGSS